MRPLPPASGRSRRSPSRSRPPAPGQRIGVGLLPLVVAVGVFDTGANALIAVASTRGAIGIVGVLSSLYPVATILLARTLLHERLGATRTAGGVIALAGAALIATG